MASLLPLSSAKSALLREGVLMRAILRNFDGLFALQLFPSSNMTMTDFGNLVERKIRLKVTFSQMSALFQEFGAIPSAKSEFMMWLQQWLTRMIYRDGNPFSHDRRAMGQALAVRLYRCADAEDYDVAEKLVLRGADLEQRW